MAGGNPPATPDHVLSAGAFASAPAVSNQPSFWRTRASFTQTTKTSIAAFTVAVEEFLAATPAPALSMALLITSDEEGPSVDGTRRVVEWLKERGETIDWCLVGEPSSEQRFGDVIKNGRRGSLSGRLTVHGIQGHVAYLAELSTRVWDGGDEFFQPTTFQISNLSAGTGAPNVIPGELKARFNLRWSPAQTLEGLQKTVTTILDRHGVKYSLEWFVSGFPFFTAPGQLSAAAAAAIEAETGSRPRLSTGGGTSDGRFIAPMGAQVLELGVVNRTIHKVNECVSVADVEALHRTYVGMFERLLPAA